MASKSKLLGRKRRREVESMFGSPAKKRFRPTTLQPAGRRVYAQSHGSRFTCGPKATKGDHMNSKLNDSHKRVVKKGSRKRSFAAMQEDDADVFIISKSDAAPSQDNEIIPKKKIQNQSRGQHSKQPHVDFRHGSQCQYE